METEIKPQAGFIETGLSAEILTVLEQVGLTVPTPIQAASIPVGLEGRDLIGIAQTGTGKTLAFSLPLISRLRQDEDSIALVIVPTRELALQVEESIRKITNLLRPPMRTISLIGGMPMYRQIQSLRNGPRIIIATPGRLFDHLERRTLRLQDLAIIVLDEADRMLDMGFAPQIERIMQSVPVERQTMMFSATMAPQVTRLVNGYTKNPARIEVAKAGSSNLLVRQEVAYVPTHRKTELLKTLIEQHEGPVLVFTRTKRGAGDLMQEMRTSGHTSAEIHSDRSLRERRQALDGFKAGQFRVLIATDIAARGIDVPNISLVVNYDLPDAADDYIHRIGRTGRAGSNGLAVTLATHYQVGAVRMIEGLTAKPMIISEHSEPVQQRREAPRTAGYGRRPAPGGAGNTRRQFNPGSRSRSW